MTGSCKMGPRLPVMILFDRHARGQGRPAAPSRPRRTRGQWQDIGLPVNLAGSWRIVRYDHMQSNATKLSGPEQNTIDSPRISWHVDVLAGDLISAYESLRAGHAVEEGTCIGPGDIPGLPRRSRLTLLASRLVSACLFCIQSFSR